MFRFLISTLCALMLLPSAANATEPNAAYLLSPGDVIRSRSGRKKTFAGR